MICHVISWNRIIGYYEVVVIVVIVFVIVVVTLFQGCYCYCCYYYQMYFKFDCNIFIGYLGRID